MMPIDKKVIQGTKLDRRVKLTAEQKKEIVALKGTASCNDVGVKYGVNRRTIDFLWHPEKLIRCNQLRKERGGSKQYYNKDKHRVAIQGTRDYKKKLLEEGLI